MRGLRRRCEPRSCGPKIQLLLFAVRRLSYVEPTVGLYNHSQCGRILASPAKGEASIRFFLVVIGHIRLFTYRVGPR